MGAGGADRPGGRSRRPACRRSSRIAMHQEPHTCEGWSHRRGLPAARGGRRGRRRPELHPRPGDDAARCCARSARRSAVMWRACRFRTGRRRASRRSSRCATRTATASRAAAVSDRARSVHVQPLRDRRVRARGARARHPLSRRLLRRRARITSGRWPKRSGATPPASRYSADMSKHAFFGTDEAVPEAYRADYVRLQRAPIALRYATTGSVIRDGRARSWSTVCVATIAFSGPSRPSGPPVFRLRSHCGKSELETSTRSRVPGRDARRERAERDVVLVDAPGLDRRRGGERLAEAGPDDALLEVHATFRPDPPGRGAR